MKNFGATWIMALVVAALAGYTFYEYKHAAEDLDRAQGERLAFTLKREDINEITLTSKGETTVLRKDGEQWKVVKPVEDLAENNAIEGYLFQVLVLKLKMFRSAEEGKDTNYAEFGLDKPSSAIELAAGDKRQSLAISSKNAFDGSFYVRQGDEVLLGDTGLAQIAERPAANFRSRHLWRFENATVEQVHVELGKDKFSFTRDKDKWTVPDKADFPLDAAKVSAWVEKVQDTLPSEFVKEERTDEDLRAYLLLKPAAVIRLGYKDKDGKAGEWVLTLGQDRAEDVFLYTNQRSTIYKATKAVADALRMPLEYFRDGHPPFQFDVERAREVRIKTAKFTHNFNKTESGWTLQGGPGDLELDQEKLVQLFQKIRNLEASEFSPKPVALKTAPQIEIRGEDGATVFTLAWGDEVKGTSAWNKNTALYRVNTSLHKGTVHVAKDKLDKLVDESMVRKKIAPLPEKPANKSESKPEKK